MKKKSQRRFAREKVLQVLYAYQINGEGLTKHTDAILSDISSEGDRNFGRKLINYVVANSAELNKKIEEKVSNWEIERIAVIDKLLLKMGMAEIMFFEDIPPKVSINEVIDISKEYSSLNSGKFINGILDAVLSDLKNEGKLKKIGRGLIDKNMTIEE
ncbi:MAG: transcription antitermination factor NusB [Bacteroidetes bacterium]|nr:transcription antitermination factor NusB [Bacteroidota bacterium]MBU1114557.1 transcription antitermination factor NusB [Bacteroidota bacterium]MBU1800474.1 transcription antitermination factor NusB [Bacteroidota bacterium]